MTYAEISAMPEYQAFIAKLRETPRDWRISVGCIRRSCDGPCCPLQELGGWPQLGFGMKMASFIILAADKTTPYIPEIRRDLLDACGLQEAHA